jgi:hypothetical protein
MVAHFVVKATKLFSHEVRLNVGQVHDLVNFELSFLPGYIHRTVLIATFELCTV